MTKADQGFGGITGELDRIIIGIPNNMNRKIHFWLSIFFLILIAHIVCSATPPEKPALPQNPLLEKEDVDPTKFTTIKEKIDFFRQRGIELDGVDPEIIAGKVKGSENWVKVKTATGEVELHFGALSGDQPNAFSGSKLESGGFRLPDKTLLQTGKMENSGNAIKIWNAMLEMDNRQVAMNYFLQNSRIEVTDAALPESRRLPVTISSEGSEVLYVHRGRDGTIVAQGAAEIDTSLNGKQAKIVTKMGEITVFGIDSISGYTIPVRVGDWGTYTHATVHVEGIEKYAVYASSPVALVDVKGAYAAIPHRFCGDSGCIKEFASGEVALVAPSRILADVLFTPLQPVSKLLIENVVIRGAIRVQDPSGLVSHLQIRGVDSPESMVLYSSPGFSVGVDGDNKLTGARGAPKMPVEVFYDPSERQYLFGLYPSGSKAIFLWKQQYAGEWP